MSTEPGTQKLKDDFAKMVDETWHIRKPVDARECHTAKYKKHTPMLRDYPEIRDTMLQGFDDLIDIYEKWNNSDDMKPALAAPVSARLSKLHKDLQSQASQVDPKERFKPWELWCSMYVESCQRYMQFAKRDVILRRDQVCIN